MKKIIVRVWDMDKRRFISSGEKDGEWETIFIVSGGSISPASVRQHGLSGEPELCELGGNYEASISTEIKDKNGREIYEGDIVKKSNGAVGQVVYLKATAGYKLYNARQIFDIFEADARYLEVIGNIYENPELLKG